MYKKTIIFGLMLIMCLGLLAGCGRKQHKVHEDGYFQYIVVGEDSKFPQKGEKGVIAIVGFTELGKEQEVIDFPRVIDSKNVRFVGYRNYHTFKNSYYHLESSNLKKIYIHDNIELIYKGAFINWIDEYYIDLTDSGTLNIMICAAAKDIQGLLPRQSESYTYVYREFYNELYDEYVIYKAKHPELELAAFESRYIRPANTVFLNNYSDEVNGGYYRLDNIESGEKITKPPNPGRAGYEFTDWYTEPECINTWDFETVPTIEENTEFRLYAGWQEI